MDDDEHADAEKANQLAWRVRVLERIRLIEDQVRELQQELNNLKTSLEGVTEP